MDDTENLTYGDRLALLYQAGVHTGPLIQDLLDGTPCELQPMTLAQWREATQKARSQPPAPPQRRPRVPGVEHPWLAANQSRAEPAEQATGEPR